MKNILTIGHNDLRVFLKDRASVVWLLLMPLAFVYFMSFSSRARNDPWDVRPAVVMENKDEGFMSRMFLIELGKQGVNLVNPEEESKAMHGITIPENFTEQILQKKEVKLKFFEISNSQNSDQLSALVEVNLIRTIIAFNGYLVEHATNTGGREPTEKALKRLIDAKNVVELDSSFAGRDPIPVGFSMSLPGILVMYLLLNLLIFGGASVAAERRNGVLKRMSINPVTQTQLLYGKLYGLMLLAVIQISFFLLLGRFLFHVNIGDNLPGIALTLLVFSWVAASLGLLIGFLIKSEDKVVGLGIMIALPIAAIGGCWWPMEIVPEFVRNLAHITPSAWAMDSLHQLITFGADFKDVLRPVGVLTIYAAAANLLAAKFFRV
jgi:ABC-2 type transport system permease protein